LETNKQKLLAVASRQDVSWDGGSGGFNDPGAKPKYPDFVWVYNKYILLLAI
jgi:hypothetical protein